MSQLLPEYSIIRHGDHFYLDRFFDGGITLKYLGTLSGDFLVAVVDAPPLRLLDITIAELGGRQYDLTPHLPMLPALDGYTEQERLEAYDSIAEDVWDNLWKDTILPRWEAKRCR